MKIAIVAGLGLAAVVTAIPAMSYRAQMGMGTTSDSATDAVVSSNGDLRVPPDYRTRYQFLGSWAIAADKGGPGSKSLHVVYASPGAIAAYRKNERFPDGTVLVKEVYDTSTMQMTTGTVTHAQKLKGWFVMVKESKNLHPKSGRWGDGWAWSWFDADSPTKTTTTNYRLQCLTCHEPARQSDLVYVQGYPPLSKTQ